VSVRTYLCTCECSSVRLGVASSGANDVIMSTGAASTVGARHHIENDVVMIIAGLWRYGDWRHVATGCGAQLAQVEHKIAPMFFSCVHGSLSVNVDGRATRRSANQEDLNESWTQGTRHSPRSFHVDTPTDWNNLSKRCRGQFIPEPRTFFSASGLFARSASENVR